MLTSCGSDDWATGNDNPTKTEQPAARPLVAHEVTVSLDDESTRVAYTPNGEGLQLSWEENETLGVYIQKENNSYVYAGTVTSTGSAGDRGARRFSGTVAEKSDAEHYVYIHPALQGETEGSAAAGTIDFTNQTGELSSIKNYIPLIWHEGSSSVSNQGYVLHLQLSFPQDPGTITQIALQTMEGVGVTSIFPASFNAATMSASSTKNDKLSISGSTVKQDGEKWTIDTYLACSNCDVNVFRTKYDVKVKAENGTFYYNEFRSFPGQESATSELGMKMLANGKCYNLVTPMTPDVATTIINSQYKINSLLGMWNAYGSVTDPFSLKKADSDVPSQLKTNILEHKDDFTARTLVNASSQNTPTFTWDMVTKQCGGNYKQNNATYNNIEIVGESTEVYVTFISEYAWSQNLLGYYHYPTSSVPSSSNDVLKTIIFPNVSKGGHVPYNKDGIDGGANVNPNTTAANVSTASDAPLAEYTTVQLLYNAPDGTVSKIFPVGTTIGFFMMRDPKASSSGHDEGTAGGSDAIDHTGYQPRTDNTLLDWNSWRLFTNTAWNGASGNTGWWDSNCWNFFCSADVGDSDNGGVIPGLAFYGAKDDASHNYNYSFSAMLYMVSTSKPASMQTQNKAYFNIGSGNQIIAK